MKHLHDNIYVGGQINATDFPKIKDAGISMIINNRPDDEEPGQLSAAEAAQLASEHQLEYHSLPMANGQPLPDNLVHDFKALIEKSKNDNVSVLAHCRSGMRSSFIWALGQIPTGSISVDEAIEKAQAAGIPLANARAVLESAQV